MCKVSGKREPLRTGGAAWYVWTCNLCRSTGTTTVKDPGSIVWFIGAKKDLKRPDPVGKLERKIKAAKARVKAAWREADRTGNWSDVEALEKGLTELMRKKNALTP